MGKLFEELKRRKVFRVAAVYAVTAWILIQVADVVLPTFGAPEWVNQTIIFLFVLAFVPVVIAAWAYEITPEGVKPDSTSPLHPVPTPSSDRNLIYAIFVLVLMVAGFQIADWFIGTESEPLQITQKIAQQSSAVTRIQVQLPEDQNFHPTRGDFDLSPDGTFFVYRGVNESGEPQLWLRYWNELSGRLLANSVAATRPKISPDGQWVVFNSQGEIRMVPIQGGLGTTLIGENADTPNWSLDGQWIYFSNAEEGVSRVPASGGDSEVITRVNRDGGDIAHTGPTELPGNRLVYQVVDSASDNRVQLLDLDTGLVKDLIAGKYPRYSDTGHLLFQANDDATLLAAPFDVTEMEITGTAIPLARDLLLVGAARAGNIGLSRTGRLFYRTGPSADRTGVPMWVSRDGEATEIDPGWKIDISGVGRGVALSPGGDSLAIVSNGDGGLNSDLWVKRLDSGPLSRITFNGRENYAPAWSNDGQSLLFVSGEFNSNREFWTRRADGSGTETLFFAEGLFVDQGFFSPDNKWLLYRKLSSIVSDGKLFAIDVNREEAPVPLVTGDFNAKSPALSADGRWLAYVSNETGRDEIYVSPFPDTDSGRWQLSSNSGTNPRWAHSGGELFYINGLNEMVAVQLDIGTTFDWNSHEVLFSMTDYLNDARSRIYDVSLDDQRFVMIQVDALEATQLIMVDNWVEDLR